MTCSYLAYYEKVIFGEDYHDNMIYDGRLGELRTCSRKKIYCDDELCFLCLVKSEFMQLTVCETKIAISFEYSFPGICSPPPHPVQGLINGVDIVFLITYILGDCSCSFHWKLYGMCLCIEDITPLLYSECDIYYTLYRLE